MSSQISDTINMKNKETNSLNDNPKQENKFMKNIYDIPLTTAMSSLFDDLSEKQKELKKEIEYHRNIIVEVDKKRYYLSSKMFPLIKSRYNKINFSNKAPITELKNSKNITKGPKLGKSGSENKIRFDNKILSRNIFKTSLINSYKPIRINMSNISTPKETSLNNLNLSPKNNKILNLSTPINKQTSKINFYSSNISKPKKRIKKYKVKVIKGWEFRNGFNSSNNKDKSLVEDKIYQKNLIINQIEIIIDSTNFFKLKHANILEEHIKKNDVNLEFLMKLNKLIEETVALYIEIGHLIINDYESFTNLQNHTRQLNPPEMVDGAEVSDEKIEFSKNVKLINECLNLRF